VTDVGFRISVPQNHKGRYLQNHILWERQNNEMSLISSELCTELLIKRNIILIVSLMAIILNYKTVVIKTST
jgi:hypothetical protein